MRILIVTSCTGEKALRHDRQLIPADFAAGSEHLAARERELLDLLTQAEDLYTGDQHVRLMRAVRALRTNSAEISLDLHILSAGYGVISGSQPIAPYECTFAGRKKADLRSWADRLGVPVQIRALLGAPYDLGLLLLGDDYLEACALDSSLILGGPTLAFCGGAMSKRLPKLPQLRTIPLTNQEAKRFSCGLVGLKGELAQRLLTRLPINSDLTRLALDLDTDWFALLDQVEVPKPASKSARANPAVDQVVRIPDAWWEKPHRSRLRYFIPEWDDLVDPDYDFLTDTHSGGGGDWSNETYAHQMYPEPNYDGILISKVVAEKSVKKKQRINEMGVHRFLRVPREFPIMGDCGAFGYIMQDTPPYSTAEILDYYTRLGFDYGVSVDHLIVTATEAQKQARYDLTIHNADEFLREHRRAGLPWEPIGAVQGWDPASYAEAAQQYVAMGYQYIALGGLVRSTTKDIVRVLADVHEVVPEHVSIHLFGIARFNAMAEFAKMGVRSVDSASYLRQAWMRDADSYLAFGGAYAAVRVPEVGRSFRAKRMLAESGIAEDAALQKEAQALHAIRTCDGTSASVEAAIDAVREYDALFGATRRDHSDLYRRTLTEQPWKSCPCDICRRDGVEVLLFRGNNRNRRRGFHNTYVFYRLLERIVNGEHVRLRGMSEDETETPQLSLFDLAGAAG